MNEKKSEVLGPGEITQMNDLEKFDERHGTDTMPVPAGDSPAALMRIALTHGESLECIEKMLELQIKYEENEAKKAYYDAVARFKENPPALNKDKYNKQFDSWYVGLGNLLKTVSGPLGEVGLSISFPTPKQDEKFLTVECKLSHRLGYSETVSMSGPIDLSPIGKESGRTARNPIQNIKSTFTYLRSATCEAVLGIAGTDASMNDNGNAAGGAEYITEEQVKIVELLAEETNSDVPKWLKIDSIDHILAKDFKTVEAGLRAKAKEKKKPARVPGEEG